MNGLFRVEDDRIARIAKLRARIDEVLRPATQTWVTAPSGSDSSAFFGTASAPNRSMPVIVHPMTLLAYAQ